MININNNILITLNAEENYYSILGVHEKATPHELRKAFCKLTKELHPDTTSLNHQDATFKLRVVLEAYENLNNPTLRNLYDMKLKNIQNSETEIFNGRKINHNISKLTNTIGYRRPFSNGEMFSLFLLIFVISLSLIFFLLFANFTGREVNSIPIWLIE